MSKVDGIRKKKRRKIRFHKGDSVMCVRKENFFGDEECGFVYNEEGIVKDLSIYVTFFIRLYIGKKSKEKEDEDSGFVYLNLDAYNVYTCRMVIFEKTILED